MLEDPVERSKEVVEDLAPDLAELYGVDLEVPDFKATRAGYASLGTAMEYHRPREGEEDEPGTVKVREDVYWPKTSLTTTVGHELGHAALYQNSDFGELWRDEQYDDGVLRAISEGVAQHFERTAYRSLGKETFERFDVLEAARYTFRYTVKRGGQRVWDATVARKYPDVYSEGRDLMTGMSREEVNEVLNDPEDFYQQIVER
ncbi:MAG: hypothetical protein SV186_06120 [Candidatus Nanohaloarchaea archaeon]|nr:hypothetical protein [Candidatus Nanohaloarchaea archaeon]